MPAVFSFQGMSIRVYFPSIFVFFFELLQAEEPIPKQCLKNSIISRFNIRERRFNCFDTSKMEMASEDSAAPASAPDI